MNIRSVPVIATVFIALAGSVSAAEQTQTIQLDPGWNAVWLHVEAQEADGRPSSPDVVFAAHPDVDIVTRLLPAKRAVEFIADPTATSLGADIWLRWRRQSMVGQNTLGGMRGNSAYLIHNSSQLPLSIDILGKVAFHSYTWVPDSYNLFGVPLGATAAPAPTFGEFFGASSSHPVTQIFKLSAGQWVAVTESERMVQGAAYWVYCRGGSQFQGPVPFVFPNAGGRLDFGETRESATLTAGNLQTTPSSLTINRLINDPDLLLKDSGGSGIVSWAITEDGSGDGTIAPATSASIRLDVTRPDPATAASYEHLYRLDAELDSGSAYHQYLPVRASTPFDAGDGGGNSLGGLWVGDVVITHATSLVQGQVGDASLGGPRLEPVKHQLRYRVILHSDVVGQVRLLEHVTLMQKQRASEDLPKEYVVVIDDSKIGDFIGIEERGGKLVGKRFDTAAYDLPRDPIPAADIDSGGGFDPSTLSDVYLLSLDLTGTLAPGGVVTTTPGSLIIDPWHRTNPYRHVFNPDHRKGFRIGREMRFEVDASGSPQAARAAGFGNTTLTGIFEEEVSGLMKSGDTHQARGRFTLQRVSDATELQ